jgi:hyperosmotically inducible periplasmic protein
MLLKRRILSKTATSAAVVVLAVAGLALAGPSGTATLNAKAPVGGIENEVRHELLMLPYYGVFDNLEFEVQDGGTVVLSGQVTQPILKSDAEHVVRRLQAVGEVINHIEVLPLSTFDDRIRIALYRALFFSPQLDRYSLGTNPSIHIIVKNGNVALVGFVANQMDKTVAEMKARGVPGTFSVTNDLVVERKTE